MKKIDLFLITYNRLKVLKRTLDSILDEKSPIREYDITVIDNNSTDGTYEYLIALSKKYTNISVIKNIRNIGGNANICRAYEMSLSKPAKYVWVLCDDDFYDFSGWNEVESMISKNYDVISVCNYAMAEQYSEKEFYSNLLLQMTFVPSGIYKKELFTDEVLTNMYDSVIMMFQQSVILMSAINNKKKIGIVKNEIVHNGVFQPDDDVDYSYVRGSRRSLKRRNDTTWILGYANVLTLLDNVQLRKDAMRVALNSKCIFLNGISDFLNAGVKSFVDNNCEHYLEEIKYVVDDDLVEAINNKIIEFENVIEVRRKQFYHHDIDMTEPISFKNKMKLFLKKYMPHTFKLLKKIRNKLRNKN